VHGQAGGHAGLVEGGPDAGALGQANQRTAAEVPESKRGSFGQIMGVRDGGHKPFTDERERGQSGRRAARGAPDWEMCTRCAARAKFASSATAGRLVFMEEKKRRHSSRKT
jgi:hypothetical protein